MQLFGCKTLGLCCCLEKSRHFDAFFLWSSKKDGPINFTNNSWGEGWIWTSGANFPCPTNFNGVWTGTGQGGQTMTQFSFWGQCFYSASCQVWKIVIIMWSRDVVCQLSLKTTILVIRYLCSQSFPRLGLTFSLQIPNFGGEKKWVCARQVRHLIWATRLIHALQRISISAHCSHLISPPQLSVQHKSQPQRESSAIFSSLFSLRNCFVLTGAPPYLWCCPLLREITLKQDELSRFHGRTSKKKK